MFKLIFVFIAIIFATQQGKAEEGFKLKSSDTLVNKTFDLNDSKGKVHVIVHSKGHLQGMPYVVDLRPACSGTTKSWEELDTLDVKSACAVDMNSLAINEARTEISINVHSASAQSYKSQMQKSMLNVQPECETKAVKHTFSIKDFCS